MNVGTDQIRRSLPEEVFHRFAHWGMTFSTPASYLPTLLIRPVQLQRRERRVFVVPDSLTKILFVLGWMNDAEGTLDPVEKI